MRVLFFCFVLFVFFFFFIVGLLLLSILILICQISRFLPIVFGIWRFSMCPIPISCVSITFQSLGRLDYYLVVDVTYYLPLILLLLRFIKARIELLIRSFC